MGKMKALALLEDEMERNELARNVRSVKKPSPQLSRIDKLRKVVSDRQANRVDGVYVDMFSASVIVQIYDLLNAENQAKLMALPLKKAATVCFKLAGTPK